MKTHSALTLSRRATTAGLLLLAAIFGLVFPAAAYVLHGAHVLELMRAELGKARQLQVEQTLLLYPDSTRAAPVRLDETVMYRFPDAFRSEIQAPTASRVQLTNRGRTLTVFDNQIVNRHHSDLDRYKDLLLINTRELLAERLPFWGIDVTVSSLGRFQGKLAYVIGARYPDESVPQIWVDKHTFHPFRWIIKGHRPGDADSGGIEVRYLQWRQVEDIQYPMQIELYRSNQLVREVRVDQIRVNPRLSEQLFSLDYLQSKYPTARTDKPDRSEADESDEIQKTLQEFNKIFE